MKIEVEVKIYAPFVRHTGEETVDVILDQGARIQDLVEYLIEQYPDLMHVLPGDGSGPERFMREVLLLKGESIVQLHDELQQGDRVHMLPAIVSG